jgi:hypothetical protein
MEWDVVVRMKFGSLDVDGLAEAFLVGAEVEPGVESVSATAEVKRKYALLESKMVLQAPSAEDAGVLGKYVGMRGLSKAHDELQRMGPTWLETTADASERL